MFNPIFKDNFQGRKHPGSCASFAVPEIPIVTESLKRSGWQ